jgi:hypothetical protein
VAGNIGVWPEVNLCHDTGFSVRKQCEGTEKRGHRIEHAVGKMQPDLEIYRARR